MMHMPLRQIANANRLPLEQGITTQFTMGRWWSHCKGVHDLIVLSPFDTNPNGMCKAASPRAGTPPGSLPYYQSL